MTASELIASLYNEDSFTVVDDGMNVWPADEHVMWVDDKREAAAEIQGDTARIYLIDERGYQIGREARYVLTR